MGFSEAGRLLAALLLVCSVVGAVPAGGGAGGEGTVRAEATVPAGSPALERGWPGDPSPVLPDCVTSGRSPRTSVSVFSPVNWARCH